MALEMSTRNVPAAANVYLQLARLISNVSVSRGLAGSTRTRARRAV